MHRTGVMAPPNQRDLPASPGLMSPRQHVEPHEVSLRLLLWSIASVLGAIELVFELSMS
jgi:hypothetical protein